MTITIRSTEKVVELDPRDLSKPVECRIWEGKTERGVPVHVYIPRIAVPEGLTPEAYDQFATELLEQAKPSAPIAAIPLRLIL